MLVFCSLFTDYNYFNHSCYQSGITICICQKLLCNKSELSYCVKQSLAKWALLQFSPNCLRRLTEWSLLTPLFLYLHSLESAPLQWTLILLVEGRDGVHDWNSPWCTDTHTQILWNRVLQGLGQWTTHRRGVVPVNGHTLVHGSIAFQHHVCSLPNSSFTLGPSTTPDSLDEVIRNGEKKEGKRSPRSEWRRKISDIVPGIGERGWSVVPLTPGALFRSRLQTLRLEEGKIEQSSHHCLLSPLPFFFFPGH